MPGLRFVDEDMNAPIGQTAPLGLPAQRAAPAASRPAAPALRFEDEEMNAPIGDVSAAPATDGERHPWRAGLEGAANRAFNIVPYGLEKFASDRGFADLTPEEDAEYRRKMIESNAKQAGLLPGGAKPWNEIKDVGSLGQVVLENFATSAPESAVGLGAMTLGALAGTAIEPGLGTVAGGALGLAANTPIQFGSELERAADSGKRSLTSEQVNRAMVTAPVMAGVETAGDLLMPVVGRTVLAPFRKEATTAAVDMVERSGVGAAIWKGIKSGGKATVKGSAEEFFTEPVQTAGERFVSGDPLADKAAWGEYRDAAITAGLVGAAQAGALHPVDMMMEGHEEQKSKLSDPERQVGRLPADKTQGVPPPPAGVRAERAEGHENLGGLDELLDYGIRPVESGDNPAQVSSAGAKGAFQLLPSTAKRMADRLGIKFDEDRLLNDVAYNRTLAREYMGILLNRYNGDSFLATTAYHAGEGNVDKWVKAYGYDPANKEAWLDQIGEKNPASAAYPRQVLAKMGKGAFTELAAGDSYMPESADELDLSPDKILAQVQETLRGVGDDEVKVGPDSRAMVLGVASAMRDADPDGAQTAIQAEKEAIDAKLDQLAKQQEKLDGEVLYDAQRAKRQKRLDDEMAKLELRDQAVNAAVGVANRYGDVLEKVTSPKIEPPTKAQANATTTDPALAAAPEAGRPVTEARRTTGSTWPPGSPGRRARRAGGRRHRAGGLDAEPAGRRERDGGTAAGHRRASGGAAAGPRGYPQEGYPGSPGHPQPT